MANAYKRNFAEMTLKIAPFDAESNVASRTRGSMKVNCKYANLTLTVPTSWMSFFPRLGHC
jgi:hypothetical protein